MPFDRASQYPQPDLEQLLETVKRYFPCVERIGLEHHVAQRVVEITIHPHWWQSAVLWAFEDWARPSWKRKLRKARWQVNRDASGQLLQGYYVRISVYGLGALQ